MSKFSKLKDEPVCICSHHPCQTPLTCCVCDAARATSAAPTYFPVQKIPCSRCLNTAAETAQRWFVDGGISYNNPSDAIHYHYTEAVRVHAAQRGSLTSDDIRPSHSNVDFSRIRIINIGTGSKGPDGDKVRARRRDILAKLIPTQIRMVLFLKGTLTESALESEKTAKKMRTIASLMTGDIRLVYERFSATNELVYIKLDRHKRLNDIMTLTQDYLSDEMVANELIRVSREIADEYVQRRRNGVAPAAEPRADLPRPHPLNIVNTMVNFTHTPDEISRGLGVSQSPTGGTFPLVEPQARSPDTPVSPRTQLSPRQAEDPTSPSTPFPQTHDTTSPSLPSTTTDDRPPPQHADSSSLNVASLLNGEASASMRSTPGTSLGSSHVAPVVVAAEYKPVTENGMAPAGGRVVVEDEPFGG
jgi:hypothetical protein